MNVWIRTDHAALEREGRWQPVILSENPLAGVPRWLVLYLALSAGLLLLWSPLT